MSRKRRLRYLFKRSRPPPPIRRQPTQSLRKGPGGAQVEDDDSKGLKEYFDGIAPLMYFVRSSVIYINSSRIVSNRPHLKGPANTNFYSSIAAKGSPSEEGEMEKPKDNTHIERTSTQFRQRVIDIFLVY